jgi:phage major head subunit gpT-like protein
MKQDENYYKSLFFSHVKEDTTTGCELWTASTNNVGYGFFRFDGKMRTVHRLRMQWEGHNIDGKVVYHDCDNYNCVNPAHLNVGTHQQKSAVMTSKGRSGTAWSNAANYQTCKYCGYHGSPAVVGRRHNEQCKHKP